MKNLLGTLNLKRDYTILEKLELGLSTSLYVLVLTAVLSEPATEYGSLLGINYLYYFVILTFFYLSFLLLNFIVVPSLGEQKLLLRNMLIIVGIIVISFALSPTFSDNVILISLPVYFFLKFSLIFLWKRFVVFKKEKGSFSSGILLTFIFYFLFMFLMIVGEAEYFSTLIPGVLIPFSIGLYSLSFHRLIPSSVGKKRSILRYLWKVFLVVLLAAIPIGLLIFAVSGNEDIPAIIALLNFPVQLFLTAPLAWLTYKRYTRSREEVQNLQKELGQSTAKFDFLRSQINPHFLFNALNTLYGTALQENAERTGEGIQQLGDMMRFMLHENMQEKISLAREIEYLENYINLQRLRTDPSPNVQILAEIQEQHGYSQIAPMLLIPFVENAFKHGISLREPSHIKIALEKREGTLYFDVYNSKHSKRENDPEKDKSGIGLSNVKQRLDLLYPGKHDLSIRETSKEFFVHLTLQLS